MRSRRIRTGWARAAAAALLAAAVLAPAAHGQQDFFYVEEAKEGRIYVFGGAKAYEEWKATGEMGKSITRVGAGPNGETIVFDGNVAINLYNFKHGLPGEAFPVQEEKKPVLKVTWKDGKTSIETDKARLDISNRIQFRSTLEQPDGGGSKGSYRIRRAKTKFEGWIYTQDLTYELQLNWADTASSLEDAAVNYDLTRGRRLAQIKGGQFKVPFGRQELTSSGSQQFVDRSIVSSEFALGRDQGLQLWGQTPGCSIEWRAGMFNGNGRNKSANDNDKFQVDARVTWLPLGEVEDRCPKKYGSERIREVKYSESDFETGPSGLRPLLAVAAQYEANDLRDSDPNTAAIDREVFGGDVVFKMRGLSVMGEYFRRVSEPEQALDPNGAPVDFDAFETRGWHAQVGYFIYQPKRRESDGKEAVRRFVEVAVRYATIEFTEEAAALVKARDDDRNERGVALNWFLNKHNLKLQADYRQIEKELQDLTDDEFRLQVQYIF